MIASVWTVESHAWSLVKSKTGMCLDLTRFPAGDGNQGRQVLAWPCHTRANQQWTQESSKSSPDRSLLFQMQGSQRLCLDLTRFPAGDGGKGREVLAWPCHERENQQWQVAREAYAPRGVVGSGGTISLNGMCLDVSRFPAGDGGQGRQVLAWPCHGRENQQWLIISPGDFLY